MFSRIEVFVYVIPFQFYVILFFLKIFLEVRYHYSNTVLFSFQSGRRWSVASSGYSTNTPCSSGFSVSQVSEAAVRIGSSE